MDSEVEKRLQKLEEKCENIPEMCETVSRIERQLVGDPFGGQRTFKSRLEELEEDHPEIKDRLIEVEETQDRTVKVSTGGAGIITIIFNAIKEFLI